LQAAWVTGCGGPHGRRARAGRKTVFQFNRANSFRCDAETGSRDSLLDVHVAQAGAGGLGRVDDGGDERPAAIRVNVGGHAVPPSAHLGYAGQVL